MATSAELLCDRSWRLRNSLWMLPAVALLGLLTWASFLYVGLKARNKTWLGLAAGFFVATVAISVLSAVTSDGVKETGSAAEGAAGAFTLAVWVGGIVAAFAVNKPWLKLRAEEQGQAAPTAPSPTAALDAAVAGTSTAPQPAAPQPVAPAPAPAPTTAPAAATAPTAATAASTVDLNRATSAQIQSATGLDQPWADHVVAVRQHLGGYRSADQLMTDAQLPPHVFAGLRDRVEVGPLPDRAGPPSTGRRLDI